VERYIAGASDLPAWRMCDHVATGFALEHAGIERRPRGFPRTALADHRGHAVKLTDGNQSSFSALMK
jgi:hypothetical protein